MFYQVVERDEYIMNGKQASDNTRNDPFLTYQFYPQTRIMKLKEKDVYSLHLNVDIGFFITVQVLAQALAADQSILRAYDGPYTRCHMLKQFHVSAKYQVASSFGTSLLLMLETPSLEENQIHVTFSSLPHNLLKYHTMFASSARKSLIVPLYESEHCYYHHFITFCDLRIESTILGNFVKLGRYCDQHEDTICIGLSFWLNMDL